MGHRTPAIEIVGCNWEAQMTLRRTAEHNVAPYNLTPCPEGPEPHLFVIPSVFISH